MEPLASIVTGPANVPLGHRAARHLRWPGRVAANVLLSAINANCRRRLQHQIKPERRCGYGQFLRRTIYRFFSSNPTLSQSYR